MANQVTAAVQAAAATTPRSKPVDPPKALEDQRIREEVQEFIRPLSSIRAEKIRNYLYNQDFYKIAKKVIIFRAPVTGDVSDYANQFENLLNSIGIETETTEHIPTGLGQSGLMVAVIDVNKPSEAARVLFDALKAGGLSPKYVPISTTNRNVGPSFALFIGPP